MHICKLIQHHNYICKQNRSDIIIIFANNTNTWKQNLDKVDHKHNPHSLWGTIVKLSNKKPPMQQNRSIRFGTKIAITDKYKAFALSISVRVIGIRGKGS